VKKGERQNEKENTREGRNKKGKEKRRGARQERKERQKMCVGSREWESGRENRINKKEEEGGRVEKRRIKQISD